MYVEPFICCCFFVISLAAALLFVAGVDVNAAYSITVPLLQYLTVFNFFILFCFCSTLLHYHFIHFNVLDYFCSSFFSASSSFSLLSLLLMLSLLCIIYC